MTAFLKSSLLRGLVILLPLIFLYLAFRELLKLMVNLATPIAELFPAGTFDHVRETELIAALLILAAALALGSLSKVEMGHTIGRAIEKHSLNKLLFYRLLKSVTHSILNARDSKAFSPALVRGSGGDMEPAYVIEDKGGTHMVVLLPWAPTPFAGSVKVVKRETVQKLPVPLDTFSRSLASLGVGMADQIEECSPDPAPSNAASTDRA
jgi:uncharacterized membrane protein